MAIRKIKAALVNTRDAPDYNTEVGYLFYDANPNGDRTLRISDGVTPGGIPLLASGDSSVGLSSATLKVADDSSTSSTFDLSGTGETLKIAGTGGITTSISGDTLTIDGTAVQGASSLSVFADDSTNMEVDLNNQDLTVSGGNSITTSTSSTQTLTVDLNSDISVNNISPLDSSGVNINGNLYVNGNSVISQSDNISSLTNDAGYITDTTLNVVADDSQTININNGGTLQFSGGNNITTSTSSDGIVTISGPSNVSDLTNDSGYISSATLKVVGDDSTGTVFDASKGDDIRFLGAGNVSVTVSGSTVIITGTGGDSSGGGGGTTYTQDTAPTSPVDGDTWLDTDSGALYVYVVEGGYGQWIETGSAGSTLDVDGVDSIRFAADDSTSTAVATSETLSILGGQGIETSVTGTGEIRISSTGSSVTTSDAQPSNPNDGDLWYETDSGSLYVYVVEGSSAHWIETGGGAGTSASVLTQDDQPESASDGNLWFDTDQGGLYVYVEENGVGNWIETGTSGSGPAIFTQDDSPSTPSNGDLWWDTDAGSLYIYVVESGYGNWVETAGSGQAGGGGITSVSADSSPTLGGNLDANSNNITNIATLSIATNGNPGSDPATDSGVGYIYAKGSTASIFVKDGGGAITQISPHNDDGEWVYYSENVRTGKKVKVNMEKMIRKLEEITGESFFEIDEPHKLKY